MQQSLRTDYLVRLVEGIRLIGSGARFERFGAAFLDHHLEIHLNHRGLNIIGNPVGGTIDSYDDTQRIGAEYSAEKDYFLGLMGKATADILHILRRHPDVREIYLLSSQVAPTGRVPEFTARAPAWPGMLGRTIHVYDSRRIAEAIVDDLLINDSAVDDLAEFVPALRGIIDEAAANSAVPAISPDHVALWSVEEDISRRLRDRGPVVVLTGIAGSGKSAAAAAFADAKRGDYQTRVWIEGSDLKRPEDLKATRLWRGGADRNLAALLKSRRCLLIIDDAAEALSLITLAAYCAPGSHILVTRRGASTGDVAMPMLDEQQARLILDRGLAESCPPDVFSTLMGTVGGHPLSLALVNNAVGEGITWDEIADDCAAIPEMVVGDQRLADRLLGRLERTLSRELSVFEWADQPSCDQRLMRSAVRSVGISKVRRQGLVAPEQPTIIRLHDVVFASLKAQKWLTGNRSSELDDLFAAHIEAVLTEEGLGLRVLATTMRKKLEALVSDDPRPAFLVALLEIWEADELNKSALGEPLGAARALAASTKKTSVVEVRAVLEGIEALYRHDKLVGGIDTARDELKNRLPAFDALLSINNLSDRTQAEIRHHRGKALNILRESERARDDFEAVLAGPCPLHATRLQLIRIYSRGSQTVDRAARLADEILGAAAEAGAAANSVVLAAVEALPWGQGAWRRKLFDKHADLIEREIRAAADAGSDQAFHAFASIGRHWAWHDSRRLAELLNSIPMKDPATAGDRACISCGEILQQAAKTREPPDKHLQSQALAYFQAVRKLDDFGLQKQGQLLVEMDRASDAERVLRRIDNLESKPWAQYWLSKATLAQDQRSDALVLIDRAIATLADPQKRYRSAFLVQRYETRRALGEMNASDDLREAIRVCEDDKYRGILERRLAETR